MKWITQVIDENKTRKQKELIKNFHKKRMENNFSRRIRIDLMTPAEKAIHDAVQIVEAAGCDSRLTDAINLLHDARNKVADFVDGVPDKKNEWPSTPPTERDFVPNIK